MSAAQIEKLHEKGRKIFHEANKLGDQIITLKKKIQKKEDAEWDKAPPGVPKREVKWSRELWNMKLELRQLELQRAQLKEELAEISWQEEKLKKAANR